MKTLNIPAVKATVLGAALALLLAACQGHYNPRLHVDETKPAPGHVKTKYYH